MVSFQQLIHARARDREPEPPLHSNTVFPPGLVRGWSDKSRRKGGGEAEEKRRGSGGEAEGMHRDAGVSYQPRNRPNGQRSAADSWFFVDNYLLPVPFFYLI